MLIHILVVLVLVGVALYVVNTFIPMDPKFKGLVNVVVVVAACLWLLQSFGLFSFHGRW